MKIPKKITPVPIVEDRQINESIKRLYLFFELDYNWDGYGADPFDKKLIEKCMHIVKQLNYQPKIFATARDSIQFEYEKDNGHYLEMEIFMNRIEYLEELPLGKTEEGEIKTIEEMNMMVNRFYE